jgi:hypothetical protein
MRSKHRLGFTCETCVTLPQGQHADTGGPGRPHWRETGDRFSQYLQLLYHPNVRDATVEASAGTKATASASWLLQLPRGLGGEAILFRITFLLMAWSVPASQHLRPVSSVERDDRRRRFKFKIKAGLAVGFGTGDCSHKGESEPSP